MPGECRKPGSAQWLRILAVLLVLTCCQQADGQQLQSGRQKKLQKASNVRTRFLKASQRDSPPKVALMFLTIAQVYNTAVWGQFFKLAGGLKVAPQVPRPAPVDMDSVLKRLHPEYNPLQVKGSIRRAVLQVQADADANRSTIDSIGARPPAGGSTGHGDIDVFRTMVPKPPKSPRPPPRPRTPPRPPSPPPPPPTNSTLLQLVEEEVQAWLTGKLYSQKQLLRFYDEQSLFSLYVHNMPGLTLPAGNIFSDHAVPNRVNTSGAYASHRLVQAELRLFEEALKDPLNHKFVLVAPDAIPLHHPAVIWSQLMGEGVHSRIRFGPTYYFERWSRQHREALTSDHLRFEHYTKGSQWIVLNREHALVATNDKHVERIFDQWCHTSDDLETFVCVSDEIFFPTLLASYGLRNEADGLGQVTHATFHGRGREGFHAYEHKVPEINQRLLTKLAGKALDVQPNTPASFCPWQEAQSAALTMFRNWRLGQSPVSGRAEPGLMVGNGMDDLGRWVQSQGAALMPRTCSLFGRKFRPKSELQTLRMMFACDGGGYADACPQNWP